MYWGYDENGLGFVVRDEVVDPINSNYFSISTWLLCRIFCNLTTQPEPIRYFMYDYTPVPSSNIQTTIRLLLTRAVEKRLIGERTLDVYYRVD